jgi:hypothetical protein
MKRSRKNQSRKRGTRRRGGKTASPNKKTSPSKKAQTPWMELVMKCKEELKAKHPGKTISLGEAMKEASNRKKNMKA